MKKFYQKDWQGIRFNSFYDCDSKRIANSEFYEKFYSRLFEKYSSWDDLSTHWRNEKESIAEFIFSVINNIENNNPAILSIGCGLGYIEKILFERGIKRINIFEVAEKSLKWIRRIIPENQIYLNNFNQLKNNEYDLVYAVAVDYVLNNAELSKLLNDIQKLLNKKGLCLIVSASFLPKLKNSQRMIQFISKFVKEILMKIGIIERGQLWGFKRTQEEYRKIIQNNGFNLVNDGLINDKEYYIVGKNV